MKTRSHHLHFDLRRGRPCGQFPRRSRRPARDEGAPNAAHHANVDGHMLAGESSHESRATMLSMARPASANSVQISIRVPAHWLERAVAFATQMSRPGLEMCRIDILRIALAYGLDAVEQEANGTRG